MSRPSLRRRLNSRGAVFVALVVQSHAGAGTLAAQLGAAHPHSNFTGFALLFASMLGQSFHEFVFF